MRVCGDDVNVTYGYMVVVLSCNGNMLSEYSCRRDQNLYRMKANDGPERRRLVEIKIHSMIPTSAAKHVTIKTRSLLEQAYRA